MTEKLGQLRSESNFDKYNQMQVDMMKDEIATIKKYHSEEVDKLKDKLNEVGEELRIKTRKIQAYEMREERLQYEAELKE